MLRKAILSCCLLALSCTAAAQSVDEIIERNHASRGGVERMRALNTIRMTGYMEPQPGMKMDILMEMKRPNRTRMEVRFQGMRLIEVFDGERGWKLDQFEGESEPRLMTEEELADARDEGEFEEAWFDYRQKGHNVELIGVEDVRGRPAYHLRITKKNGRVEHWFFDRETYLETKFMLEGGKNDGSPGYLGGFREIEGILWPTWMESETQGTLLRMNFERIEFNVDIDDRRFEVIEAELKTANAEQR